MEHTRRLLDIMARLRDPVTGCPWDLAQDFASLIPYTLEEAYEVADAIERQDMADLRDELGDLLLQVAFHARIAEERAQFGFEDVAKAIGDKLIRRHPHVFDAKNFESDDARIAFWEHSKSAETAEKKGVMPDSALDGIAESLPALMRAQKLQKRAARHGFDWSAVEPVFAKVEEELEETRQAFAAGDHPHIEEEIGDLLFVVVNLARHLNIDAETALRGANQKFTQRFQFVERRLKSMDKRMGETKPEELNTLWEEAKRG